MEEARNTPNNTINQANGNMSSPSQYRNMPAVADDVSFSRSQDVDLYQVTLAKDSAWPFLVELGTSARCVQFIDLNRNEQSFNLKYINQIKLCDDALTRLNYLTSECEKAHITLQKPKDLEQFNESLQRLVRQTATSETVMFDLIVKDVREKNDFIKTQKGIVQEMLKSIQQMELFKTALKTVSSVLDINSERPPSQNMGTDSEYFALAPENESLLMQPPREMQPLQETLQMTRIDRAAAQQHQEDEIPDLITRNGGSNQNQNGAGNRKRVGSNSFQSQLNVVAGVIKEGETSRMTRLLYRVSRGRVATFFDNIGTGIGDLENTGRRSDSSQAIGSSQLTSYAAYVLVFTESDYLKEKVEKIAQSFSLNSYTMPPGQSDSDREKQIKELNVEITKSKDLLVSTRARLRDYLASIQVIDPLTSTGRPHTSLKHEDGNELDGGVPISQIQIEDGTAHTSQKHIDLFILYKLFIERERQIYVTLNTFKAEANLLLGFCWIPARQIGKALAALRDVHEEDPQNLEMPRLFKLNPSDYRTDISPPTQIITNDFTCMFQLVVDLFDVPKYKELNPALFTCVTFPFLFGVMFGDICHGSLLLIAGITLCILNRRMVAEPGSGLANLFKVRHMILLLGFFSTYCGLLYNDFASIPLQVFGTCYQIKGDSASQLPGCVLKSGLDPVWYLASNELAYVNSMKMKIAVILGVVHMTLGICLKGFNLVYFSRKIDFCFEFIPQLVILLALFGYMDMLIIVKWLTDFTGREDKAPSIIQTMISMFISMGAIPVGTDPILGQTGKGQQTVSLTLLVLTLICIPTLLCCKPILLTRGASDHKKRINAEKKQQEQFDGVQLVNRQSKDKMSDEEDCKLLLNNGGSPIADHESCSPPNVMINFSLNNNDRRSEHQRESYLVSVEYGEEAKQQDWRQQKTTIQNFHEPEQQLQPQQQQIGEAAGGPSNNPTDSPIVQKPVNKLMQMLRDATKDDQADSHGSDEDGGFGILMIHQLIETIEFVLGTVSNTASYLRLWALSLAHSQLATVFFGFTVKSGLDSTGGSLMSFIMIWVGFVIFASVTVGVMMCMDVMECFLHTLRLHWVEFQSKFYQGGGHAFVPFVINENLPERSQHSSISSANAERKQSQEKKSH